MLALSRSASLPGAIGSSDCSTKRGVDHSDTQEDKPVVQTPAPANTQQISTQTNRNKEKDTQKRTACRGCCRGVLSLSLCFSACSTHSPFCTAAAGQPDSAMNKSKWNKCKKNGNELKQAKGSPRSSRRQNSDKTTTRQRKPSCRAKEQRTTKRPT